jgi:hypothetical protein
LTTNNKIIFQQTGAQHEIKTTQNSILKTTKTDKANMALVNCFMAEQTRQLKEVQKLDK